MSEMRRSGSMVAGIYYTRKSRTRQLHTGGRHWGKVRRRKSTEGATDRGAKLNTGTKNSEW